MTRTATIEQRGTARAARGAPGPSAFADAMSGLAAGVVMVTCWVEGRPWGMTVSAVTSVSADPPTILVSLGSETVSARAIETAGLFGVGILDARHRDLARHGSAPGAPKFLEPFTEPGVPDSAGPVVTGAIAHLDCTLASHVVVADHTVFFGRVRAVRLSDGAEPLVYFRRAYRTLAPAG